MELVDEVEKVHLTARRAIAFGSPVQVTPSSPTASPLGVVAVNPVLAPSPVSAFVTAANADICLEEEYLGLKCTLSDVVILYERLYLPLKAEQNHPVNDFGLVIDNWIYYCDPPGN